MIIERGVLLLLIFTPLAFGTVQPWSISLMEITAYLVLGAWLLTIMTRDHATISRSWLIYPAGAFLLLILFQLVPLPLSFLSVLSPSTAALYAKTGLSETWRTLSINRGKTAEELHKVLAYFAIFVVIINHHRTRGQIKPILHVIIGMGFFIAVFAVVQKITWNGKIYWIYPVDPSIQSDGNYIWGPYINHNHFAGYMEMAIFPALGMLFHEMSKTNDLFGSFNNSKRVSSRNEIVIPFLVVAILLMAGGLFMSLSRGGIIGFCAAAFLFVLLNGTRRTFKKKSRMLALAGVAIVITVATAGWDRLENRFGQIGEQGKIKRTDVWRDSLNIIKDFPVLGTGLGTFSSIYPKYQTKNVTMHFEHAENDYVELFTDMGAAGFVTIGGLLFTLFVAIIQGWKNRHDSFIVAIGAAGVSSCTAIVVHSLTDFNMRIPANALTFTVIAAFTYVTVFTQSGSRRRSWSSRSLKQEHSQNELDNRGTC